jgi:hypothetical protein
LAICRSCHAPLEVRTPACSAVRPSNQTKRAEVADDAELVSHWLAAEKAPASPLDNAITSRTTSGSPGAAE